MCFAVLGRLPFLLKVLSAAQALSIQVHPSRAQAQAGFLAENERGLAPGDPARNYVDDWPKPELLYALTPFEVMAGLRARPTRRTSCAPWRWASSFRSPIGFRPRLAQAVMAAALASVLEWPDCRPDSWPRSSPPAPGSRRPGEGCYADACAAAVRVAADLRVTSGWSRCC